MNADNSGRVVCPEASTFDQTVIYSEDNMGWLGDFRDAMTQMLLTGYNPEDCASPPCQLVL